MLKRSIFIIASVIFIIGCGGRADTNNSQTDIDPIIADRIPPVISNLADSNHSDTSVLISWETDENANANVSWGLESNALVNRKFSVSGFVKYHSFSLTQLLPLTLYYFRVESCDRNNNCARSSVQNFQTTDIPDLEPPAITDIMLFSVTYSSAVLSWRTSEPSSSEFSYGTSSTDLRNRITDTEFLIFHRVTVPGLRENTQYYFQIKACDAAQNCSSSEIGSFKTPKQEDDDDGGLDPDLP